MKMYGSSQPPHKGFLSLSFTKSALISKTTAHGSEQWFLRSRLIFKIAIFGRETWPLRKVPEVGHILSCTTHILLKTYHYDSGIFRTYFSCFQIQVQFSQRCTRHTLRQVHRITPKMTLNTNRSKVPIYIQTQPRLPIFAPFRSTASHFRVTCHFETSELNDPKTTLNTNRLKDPIYI